MSAMEGNDGEGMRTAGPSPELRASIFSLCTWHWLRRFVTVGNAKTLEAEDLYDMNPKEGTEHCEELWDKAMGKVRRGTTNASPSVWKLMWHCFGWEYARASLFKPVWLVAIILQVYTLRALIKAVSDPDGLTWWWGTLLVLGMFFMSAIASISQHMCFTLSQKVGMKIRSTISIVVFNKLLSTKLVSLVGTHSGLMLNLVTNDSQKLLDAATYFHFGWFALIEVTTVSVLAIIEVGISAIPGMVVAFLTQPLQAWMAKVGSRLRTKAVKYTDSRVHLTGEILHGIRVIKYNGWIAPFLSRISALRSDEMSRIRRASFVRASASSIRDCVTPLSSLATYGTYLAVHNGRFMQPSRAFTVLALFSVLVRTFSIAPLGVQFAGEAIVAVRRLEKLLNSSKDDEDGTRDKDREYNKDNEVCKDTPDRAAIVRSGSFSWKESVNRFVGSDFVRGSGRVHIEVERNVMDDSSVELEDLLGGDAILKNINFSVGKGELVAIHGAVGSGKSSLLYAILGEMQCLKGSYFIQRNIAYVPQQPWILNDTVRQNILFVSPYDPDRYQRTIAACALDHDISQFVGGHNTEIGDRGINLSGGQKARISLARACYSSAPVVLLDDPLAAVDVPTAKHLIEHVLNGILKGRTVVLVTHNRTALSVCDRVYSMRNGFLHEDEMDRSDDRDTQPLEALASTNEEHLTCGTEVDAVMPAEAANRHADNVDSNAPQKLEQISFDLAEKEKGKSTVKEDRVQGNIRFATWIAYGRAAGGILFFSLVMLVFIFGQAVRVMVDYWLRVWTDEKYHLKQHFYLIGYASFAIGAALLSLSRALLFAHATMLAAKKMHDQMAERVLRSPQLFFDQNVAGRILNRFSKDQALVDETLPYTAQQMLEFALSSLGSLIFIGVLIPWFLLAFPPFFIIFFYVQHRYVVISRELKRLEAVSRSPMYAHFTQTLQGIASVRAYGADSNMHKIFLSLIDANHRSYILFVHMARWLGIRLDFATCMCVTLASALIILLRHSISPGLAGVVLVQSMQVTGFIQFAVRQAAETENYLTSVERINAYANLPSEADPHTAPGIIAPNWPSKGKIEFVKYTMTYREGLPPILNEISFEIKAKEKIGILGRTGVGKSSLAAALFRMVENKESTGDILIDGVNIRHIGLDDLRQRLSIIPQDPILFQGSLRFNLDPFEAYTDQQIFEALSRVHLREKIQSLDRGLDSDIAQNGENFSVGQRQLICLARSLLRRSQIIVMDEATAAVDGETDSLIQTTIRTTFHDCTLLTIAHRIDTIIDCDRVLILAAGGRIAEFDSPHNLLSSEAQGMFAEMVRQTGPMVSQRLQEAAQEADRRRREPQHGTLEQAEGD